MDLSDTILGLVSVIVGMIGFFLGRLSDTIRSIEKQVADIPKEYVLKSEYRDDIDEIKSTLKDIFKILREHEKSSISH
jgi:F420-0:gamma-glutamyl ligase-like protein